MRLAVVAGTGNGPHAGFSGNIAVRAGTAIVFTNDDNTVHQIHADPHGSEMAPGETDTLYFNEVGSNIRAYCHEHDNTGDMRFLVE